MKRTLLLVCTIALFTAVPAFAWHCPTGQHWVQVAPGTPNATIVEGIPFACFPDNPPVTPKDPSTNSTSNSSSTSNSTASSTSVAASTSSATQSQKQSQTQSQTATGGNASATGGNAVNEGNNLSTSYVNNQVRQAPMAYAPEAFSTAACRVGASAGVSAPIGGISLGGSKKDKDCERATLANGFFARGSNVAGCKLLMKVKVIKEALTFDECMATVVRPAPVAQVLHEVQPSITVNVPAPVVILPPAPVVAVAEKTQVVTVVAPKPHVKRKPAPCPITVQNGVKIIHEQKGEK